MLSGLRNRKNWIRMLLSAVIFFAVALPFRQFLSLMPGITEIRPANVIPPVLGLIWGAPAAFGISIGNLISDCMSGSNLFVCVTGFISNFIYAYLPYKLWYSSLIAKDDVFPTLGSVRKILKYIYVILLDSLVVTGMLSLIFETAGFSPSANSYGLLLLNNFDFAVLLGVPLLIFIERFRVDYALPAPHHPKRKTSILFNSFLFAGAALGLVWFFLSSLQGAQVNSSQAAILLGISILLALSSISKPFHYTPVEQKQRTHNVRITIKTKVAIGILMVAVIFIVFIGVTAYSAEKGESVLAHWSYVYSMVGLAINIIFAVAIVFLWYVEHNMVNPLVKLSQNVEEFAARPASSGEIPTPRLTELNTGDEITLLAASCNTMMGDIVAYMENLRAVTAEKERIGAELNVAKHIQASMLPSIFPAFPERPEMDIYATMTPAKEVGGDFYDFFLIDDDRLAMVMADVSGKGVPAALFMVIAKTLLKNVAQTNLSPKEILEKVNDQLCVGNEAEMFVTVWLGILEISTGKMTCANAGHEYPVLKRANSDYELFKDRHGFVLAGMEGSRYKEYELQMYPGDKLFLYTDGVPEATNAHNELYGVDRMLVSLNRHKDVSGEVLLHQIKEDIDIFVGKAPQFDDITMLGLELNPQNASGMKKMKLTPTLEALDEVTAFIERELETADISMKLSAQINIAVDEIFSNIARYSGASDVTVGVSTESGRVSLRFADNGRPYDPIEKSDPDTALSAENREIGGLGIFIVKKFMDTVAYEYRDGLNILTLTKNEGGDGI